VLWAPYARGSDYGDLPVIQGGTLLAQSDWQMFCAMIASDALAHARDEVIRAVTTVLVSSGSPELTTSMVSEYVHADVTAQLPLLTMPVLVLRPEDVTGFIPPAVVEEIVAQLPRGRLVGVSGVPVLPLVGAVDTVIDTIHGFLDTD
jgi:pimeloyl-ACP methyl ester carboxylesterase